MDLGVEEFLIGLLILCLIILYLRFLWGRRKLYTYSWNVPGPFSYPIMGAAYKFFGNPDDIIDTMVDIFKEYPSPSKLWLGPQLIYSIHDPQQIEKVLTNPKCFSKDYMYDVIVKCIGTGLLTAPVSKWKKHRKQIMPSFNQKILDQFTEVFTEQAVIFTEVLKKYSGRKGIDISVPINAMMMDVVCETAMGLKMNTQGGNSEFSECLERVMEILTLRIFKIWYHPDWLWRLSPLSKELDKNIGVMHRVTSQVITKKMELLKKDRENRRDSLIAQVEEGGSKKRLAFLDLIMENSDFTEAELRDEVEIFLVAGTDTSSVTASFCFEMLGMFQDVQQKVYEEAIDILGEERLVESSDLPSLKYLERVIKETLRLFPVAVYFLRIVGEDLDLGNCVIPASASAIFSSLNIHRSPEYWPDPLKFDPDRFLPEEVAKRPPCSYIPFSYGPRNCLGMKYAMMSLKTLIATTVRKYRIFTQYKSLGELELKTKILIRPRHGFKVYVERR